MKIMYMNPVMKNWIFLYLKQYSSQVCCVSKNLIESKFITIQISFSQAERFLYVQLFLRTSKKAIVFSSSRI